MCENSVAIIMYANLRNCTSLYTVDPLYNDTLYNSKIVTSVEVAQKCQITLNLPSLRQQFGLTLHYIATNTVNVKRFDCRFFMFSILQILYENTITLKFATAKKGGD